MNSLIDRRLLIKTGLYGLSALGLPGGAFAATEAALTKGFSHGVASGEPSQDSVLLWTRYVSNMADTKLIVEISETADFRKMASGTETIAAPSRDYTSKAIMRGLKPGRSYYYRFIAPDGTKSVVGRTRTLPAGAIDRFRMAVFSCSNMPFGWFNAYAHAARTGDFDLALHLGDYIYEYQRGNYPSPRDALAQRLIEPANEIVSLADYRLRYASYRADPDLQAVHARAPMIVMWDDHEFTNDAYADGAQNHQSDEGDWQLRKRMAEQAYREWMPVRDIDGGERWSSYTIGDLARLFLTESRIGARSKQPEWTVPKGADAAAATAELKNFRDGIWQDPARTMLGAAQENWLAEGFRTNKSRWNIWAQQTIVGNLRQPQQAIDWLAPDAPSYVRDRVQRGTLAARIGIPSNMDAWDGYPAARARTLSVAQDASADMIVLTGDTHNAWAFDLDHDGRAAGVEFAGQSVSSPGLESAFTGTTPATVAKTIAATNPGLKWMDAGQRGYMVVELTPMKASSEWRFVDTIKERSSKLASIHRMATAHGMRKLR
ncbi:MAG: alkaline phosphatase D family protein [Sphingorhabdus sp.]